MTLENDTRGWIMTCISGIACVLGATFIFVDLVIRLFRSKKNFRIQDSDSFLGCSLSLSAGVMLFSALYSMLPSAKQSLIDGGSGTKAASWILVACFLGGVFGIQLFSRVVHHFMPSQAVDCDHSHDEEEDQEQDLKHDSSPQTDRTSRAECAVADDDTNIKIVSETTPLLIATNGSAGREGAERRRTMPSRAATLQRPTIQSRVTGSFAHIVSTSKSSCEVNGSCHGYTDPCGHDCFKNVNARGGVKRKMAVLHRPAMRTSASAAMPALEPIHSHESGATSDTPFKVHDSTSGRSSELAAVPTDHDHQRQLELDGAASENNAGYDHDLEIGRASGGHHHHVPRNAFLSISLQTSIAIALHKLPEGFITYATNHANPSLGVTVFLAIAVHNTSEGFALALPIFLATGSRIKALVLTLILGGLSQPLGAGVAAGWLKIAERDRGSNAERGISDRVYGGMFAVTAGIMASVAISLIQESFELSHNRNWCLAFIFIGMGILGMSSALTA